MIEDVRQAIQDFIAPELRAISARLDSFDKRFDAAEKVATANHNEVLARLATVDEKFERLLNAFEIDKRLERLEARQSPQPS